MKLHSQALVMGAVATVVLTVAPLVAPLVAQAHVAPNAGTEVTIVGLSPGTEVTVTAWPSLAVQGATPADVALATMTLGTASADSSGTAIVDVASLSEARNPNLVEEDGSTFYQISVATSAGDRMWTGDSNFYPRPGCRCRSFPRGPAWYATR